MPRKYRRKPTLARKVNYLTKMVKKNKPELKNFVTSFNGSVAAEQTNKLVCDPLRGVNSNQRIGDEIKATSYYGVFYFNMRENSTLDTQSIRLVHYLANKPNELTLENSGGFDMLYNELPAEDSYIIKEDKLITLSKQGPAIRKVIIKGKFKYPINIKWKSDLTMYDWHPRLTLMSDVPIGEASVDKPNVEGQIRYYYTDV